MGQLRVPKSPVSKAENPPYRCTACDKAWRLEGENWEKSDYYLFVRSLSGLIEGTGKGFEVKLEFNYPAHNPTGEQR
jgi:hypothetical protein